MMGCGEPLNGLHGKTPAFYSTACGLTVTVAESRKSTERCTRDRPGTLNQNQADLSRRGARASPAADGRAPS